MGPDVQYVVVTASVLAVVAFATASRRGRVSADSQAVSPGWSAVMGPRHGDVRADLRAAALIAIAALTTAGPTLYGQNDVSRAVVGFVGLLLAPGAAVVLFLRMRDPLTELALSAAVSMAVIVLGSQVLLAVHLWRPEAAFQVVLLLAAPLLTWHACVALAITSSRRGSHART